MLDKIEKKYWIKIPNDVNVLYCSLKKILVFSGPLLQCKSLKLSVKPLILESKRIIKISSLPFVKLSNSKLKSVRAIQGTTCALIKQLLIETTTMLYEKLKFVGVGYRLVPVESFENQLILLRLGFSHLFYFKIPSDLKIFYKKRVQLFISGSSYQFVTQFSSKIRALKKPEPYKGKGILYENEKITLKKGKKI